MTEETKPSKYLLGQEHLTDRELDTLYDLSKNLQSRLEALREYDKQYRDLEEVNTEDSEKERANLLNSCTVELHEVVQNLQEMETVSADISTLFLKAKGALEEKLDLES